MNYTNNLNNEIANILDNYINDYSVSMIIAEKYIKIRREQSRIYTLKFYNDLREYNISRPYINGGATISYIAVSSLLKYMISFNGIRKYQKWKIIGSSCGLKNLNKKEKLTIREKADDIEKLGNYYICSQSFMNEEW